MKELSIEDKAKAYDELIKRLNKAREDVGGYTFKSVYDEVMSELAESKDEKFLRYLIDCCKDTIESDDKGLELSMVTTKRLFAWLEKQGEKGTNGKNREIPFAEQNPADKIQLGKKYKCIASPRYSTFMIGEIYKPEDKFLCSLMNFCYDCFEPIEDGEQKPAEKFPKYKKGDILTDGKNKYEVLSWDYTETGIAAYYMKGAGFKFSCNCEEVDKKLYIVEQKPAWSEDDEKYWSIVIAEFSKCAGKSVSKDEWMRCNGWLNSLKDRVVPQK